MLGITMSIVILNIIQQQVPVVRFGEFPVSMEVVVQIVVLLLVNLIVFQGLKRPQSFQQISDSDIKALHEYGKNKVGMNNEKLQKVANTLQI